MESILFYIVFAYRQQMYTGPIFVAHAGYLRYYTLFFRGRQSIFFIDAEDELWIEHGLANTALACIVGRSIDLHYHPDRF